MQAHEHKNEEAAKCWVERGEEEEKRDIKLHKHGRVSQELVKRRPVQHPASVRVPGYRVDFQSVV